MQAWPSAEPEEKQPRRGKGNQVHVAWKPSAPSENEPPAGLFPSTQHLSEVKI